MTRLITRAAGRLQRLFESKPRSGIEYWEQRAKKFGRRSVLNIGHSEEEMEKVTQWQKEILFPLLRRQLTGTEKTILDFGCGPGRFTRDLAELIHGKAIGVDPVERFLKMAPRDDRVEYRHLSGGRIPCAAASMDMAWICLVFGGLTDPQSLDTAVQEIDRVLKPGGLLFLVENTSKKPDADYWRFRSPDAYRQLFRFALLAVMSQYNDLGETITVMAGRKNV
ncbi:MAG: hypothetical protein AUI36_33665 [Cyanobacteria bacterium 13_1_40CM_2_61_4]|nr:MAG: hypothetical protein AUI36_33665 [Cyanobacteria bacterium 13_1_40CM_2_61_4]